MNSSESYNLGNGAPGPAAQASDHALAPARRREIWPVPPAPFTADEQIDEAALASLIDFYAGAGVDGLFILAYTGEAFELTRRQRLEVCRAVVAQARGRVQVIAAGNFASTLAEQIDELNELADVGVDAAAVFLSTLPDPQNLVRDLCMLGDRVSAPLGVYECPAPEHRLLSSEEVGQLAATGRFVFMKETSRNRAVHRAKLAAAEGTPLKVMQANFGQLPASLEDGCPGFCGIIASAFPELTDAYCNARLTPEMRMNLFAVLSEVLASMTVRHYPASLKYVLKRRGLHIDERSRMATGVNIDHEDRLRMDDALDRLGLLGSASQVLATLSAEAPRPRTSERSHSNPDSESLDVG